MTVKSEFEYRYGPFPGLLGAVTAMHGRYYAAHWGFPVTFECSVGTEMSGFFGRYNPESDQTASLSSGDEVVGSITLDGSDPELAPRQAHLRWFIISEDVQSKGLGKSLMRETINFAKNAGYASIYLTTFKGLGAAAKLYDSFGFELSAEDEGDTWGRKVVEQRFELIF